MNYCYIVYSECNLPICVVPEGFSSLDLISGCETFYSATTDFTLPSGLVLKHPYDERNNIAVYEFDFIEFGRMARYRITLERTTLVAPVKDLLSKPGNTI